MSKYTHIDEIVDYTQAVVRAIASSQRVVGLILDNAQVSMSSPEVRTICGSHIFDYDYVDDTLLKVGAYVLVDTAMFNRISGSVERMEIYVRIICHKNFMRLDPDRFPGVKGNRCDNISREIDLLLEGSRDYGIGRLELMSATPASAPSHMTGKLLTYRVHAFAVDRDKGNYGCV